MSARAACATRRQARESPASSRARAPEAKSTSSRGGWGAGSRPGRGGGARAAGRRRCRRAACDLPVVGEHDADHGRDRGQDRGDGEGPADGRRHARAASAFGGDDEQGHEHGDAEELGRARGGAGRGREERERRPAEVEGEPGVHRAQAREATRGERAPPPTPRRRGRRRGRSTARSRAARGSAAAPPQGRSASVAR